MVRKARPTSEGLAVLGLTGAIAAVAAVSGNNLLYLMVAALLALWGLEVLLGSWNLRAIDAVRRLPAELAAETDGTGRIVVRNRRRWMSALALRVEDVGAGTDVAVDEVAPGASSGAVAHWRFDRRGVVGLEALRIRSRFPLGWVEHEVVVPAHAELVVFPRAAGGARPGSHPEEGGHGHEVAASRGGMGDFAGLRPYDSGDRLRSVHWATTARVGQVMVVQRGGEAEPAVRVVVTATPPDAWEAEISRAAGEVGRAFERGWRVGLELPPIDGRAGLRLPAQGGGSWRRVLLETLARLPEAR